MQMAFDLGAAQDIEWVRDRLKSCFGHPGQILLRTPIGQLVKSLISGRTRDAVSLRAYHRLIDRYPGWSDIARATTADIEAVIKDVTFPDVKARYLHDTLRVIEACHADFDLAFLGLQRVTTSLEWLEQLPGVGRKVSASTLNFSNLHMPAFVIDTHVLRVLRRFAFVQSNADTRSAYEVTMAILHEWTAADLAELHILMKHLGQTICRADLACCRHCPISQRCHAATAHSRHRVASAAR